MIIFQGIIDKITTLKDRSLKVTIETQELTNPKEIAEVFDFSQKPCAVALKEGEFEANELEDIGEAKVEYKGDKTPGQLLRNTLYVYWNQKKLTGDFDTFYKKQMGSFTDRIKEKLN